MREDEIRIFLQEMCRREYDDDIVISELDSVHSELVRSRQAVPPSIELQDLLTLNREALERANNDAATPTNTSLAHQLTNGHTPHINGAINNR
jgi:hypothetical protein